MNETLDHRTCTYCVHNENPNRLSSSVVCKLKHQDCNYWSKTRFESISQDEVDTIDEKIKVSEATDRSYRLGETITICYVVVFLLLVLCTAVWSIVIRFSNPTLTETQLIVVLFKKQWLLDVVIVIMWLLPKIFKK